jgi:hypothetical protein
MRKMDENIDKKKLLLNNKIKKKNLKIDIKKKKLIWSTGS